MTCKENVVEVFDSQGESVTPIPPSKKVDLHNFRTIRLEMSRIYREARQGKISPQDATRYIYMLRETSRVLQSEIENDPVPKEREQRFSVGWMDSLSTCSDDALKEEMDRRALPLSL